MTAKVNPQAQICFICLGISLKVFIFSSLVVPFLREKSGLLIETPSQTLDLAEYPEQNRKDVRVYIQRNVTPLTPSGLGEESNFMYVSQIISAINEGFYTEPFESDRLPGLEAYYQQHWQKMQRNGLSAVKLAVLQTLTQQGKDKVTKSAIAEIIDEDEYEVGQVLENWYEFLHFQQVNEEILYSFYHFSFPQLVGRAGEVMGIRGIRERLSFILIDLPHTLEGWGYTNKAHLRGLIMTNQLAIAVF